MAAIAGIETMVDIPRTCDRCGHNYTVALRVAASAGGRHMTETVQGVSNEVRKDAKGQVNNAASALTVFGVYCPECRQFSKRSLTYHFPNGVRMGLQKLISDKIESNQTAVASGTPLTFLKTFLIVTGVFAAGFALSWKSFSDPRDPVLPAVIVNNLKVSIAIISAAIGLLAVLFVWLTSFRSRKQNELLANAQIALMDMDDPSLEQFLRERYINSKMRLKPDALEWATPLITAKGRWSDPRPGFTMICEMCGEPSSFKSKFELLRGDRCSHCGNPDPFWVYRKTAVAIFGALIVLSLLIGLIKNMLK